MKLDYFRFQVSAISLVPVFIYLHRPYLETCLVWRKADTFKTVVHPNGISTVILYKTLFSNSPALCPKSVVLTAILSGLTTILHCADNSTCFTLIFVCVFYSSWVFFVFFQPQFSSIVTISHSL